MDATVDGSFESVIDAIADYTDAQLSPATCIDRRTYPSLGRPSLSVGVTVGVGVPRADFATAITLGLARQDFSGRGFPHRLELVSCWSERDPSAGIVLAAAALHSLETGFFPAPGMLLRDAVASSGVSFGKRFPDLLFVHPFCWGRQLREIDTPGRSVWFVQALPITREESDYKVSSGMEAFEMKLRKSRVDLRRLDRSSVV